MHISSAARIGTLRATVPLNHGGVMMSKFLIGGREYTGVRSGDELLVQGPPPRAGDEWVDHDSGEQRQVEFVRKIEGSNPDRYLVRFGAPRDQSHTPGGE